MKELNKENLNNLHRVTKQLNEERLNDLCEFIAKRSCIEYAAWLGVKVECRTKRKCNPNCPFRTKENIFKWLKIN